MDDSRKNVVKPFQLVKFNIQDRKVPEIKIVPRIWISYDKEKKQLMCPFPAASSMSVRRMVANQKTADPTWKVYSIKIRGQSGTYEGAERKVKELVRKRKCVLSSGSEQNWPKKSDALEKQIRSQSLVEQMHKMKGNLGLETARTNSRTELSKRSRGGLKKAHSLTLKDLRVSPSTSRELLSVNDCSSFCSSSEDIRQLSSCRSNSSSPASHACSLESMLDIAQRRETPNSHNGPSSDVLQTLVRSVTKLIEETRESNALMRRALLYLEQPKASDIITAELSLAKYNVEIPIKSVEDLIKFEKQLRDDEKCLRDTIDAMKVIKDDTLSKQVIDTLKKFLTREVAMQFTAIKKMPSKLVLEKECPKLMSCMKEAILAHHRSKGSNQIASAIGTGLTNSVDWYNSRKLRKEKKVRDSHMDLDPDLTNITDNSGFELVSNLHSDSFADSDSDNEVIFVECQL